MKTSNDSLFIGLMSGTSLDGVDAVLATFKPHCSVITSAFTPFKEDFKSRLKSLTISEQIAIENLANCERELTNYYIEITHQLLHDAQKNAEDICAIGAHGQTIRHYPKIENNHGYSLQILDGALLAVATGIDVVCQFRQKDIALKGQGAPLVPAFHQYLFNNSHQPVAVVNIGGISNISLIMPGEASTGYDIGPGNTLLDQWYQNFHDDDFDENGKWARQGVIHASLLKDLLHDDYFKMPPPKSTGPEYFNLSWLGDYLKHYPDLEPKDIQSTLLELTAISIANACKNQNNFKDVYLCGGGQHNHYLVSRINFHLPGECKDSSEIGIDGDFMEATAFAWLAMRRIQHQSGNLPEVTGARKKSILGALHLAD